MSGNVVVLLSGGIDSATALAIAIEDQQPDKIITVSCGYKSNHQKEEQAAAEKIVDWYTDDGHVFDHRVIQLPDIFSGGKSALFSEVPMPQMTYKEIHQSFGPSPTIVPFRNANLISIATSIAVVAEADLIYVGMHGEDAHNWAYPDCTPEFLGAMANAIRVGTYDKVRLRFPLIWMMKTDVVASAHALGVPAGLTWSCYRPVYGDDTSQPFHCGKCPTCIERIHAFMDNHLIDPVAYDPTVELDWSECDAYD